MYEELERVKEKSIKSTDMSDDKNSTKRPHIQDTSSSDKWLLDKKLGLLTYRFGNVIFCQ